MHFMRAEAWTEAIRYLERSNAAKEDADALFYLAQSYFHTDMKGKALEAIERCVVLEPRNPAALVKLGEYRAHASKFAPALEALRAAQQINPQEPGLDLALGVVNLSLLDVEAARVALERAEKKDPDNLAVLSNLATACAKARDHAAAKRYYERLLALGQDDAHYYMGLGAALLGLGEYEAAIRALAQAVERNPKIAEAHFHLTRAYRSAGHAEEAERELRIFSALKANPFQPFDERTDLERSLWQRAEDFVKDGKESEALKLLATGNASGNEPNYLVGALCYSLGHYAAAEVLLTEAIKAAPDLPKVHAYLGLTYLELGRMAEAESAIRDEATRNPRDPLALMAVGELHFRKQEWAEAARALEESRVVEPRVLLMLCEAQLESGQKARAQESAQLVATLAQDPRTIASLKQLFERYGLAVEGAPASGGSADGADAGP
jgi:tetratricopeptide (TPR) repeat protein